jgi:TolB-like protein/Flp pilus assembly protein TadD
MTEHRHGFGPFSFDPLIATLWRQDTLVPLGSRSAALLAALVEANGAVVTRADLLDRVWPGTAIEDSNLSVQVATLRKTLGTRPDGEEWISTIPRVGYRLLRDGGEHHNSMPAIAVLPFLNLSNDPEQEHVIDGIVEDLITALSRFRTFAVIARNSSFVYKDRAVDIRDIARALGVRYVLEGSARRAGQRMRVSAQLIDGASGAHIWAENLDGAFGDVLDFQDRLASRIVGSIEPQIRQAEIDRARRKRPDNLDAYDLYLRALHLTQSQRVVRVEDYDEAIRLAERAINLDENFAPVLAHAAWSHEKRLTRGGTAPPGVDDAAAAVKLAERALMADPNDAMVLLVAGTIAITIQKDFAAGFPLVQRALALNPNSLIVVTTAAYFYFYRGDFDAAVTCAMRALLLTPGAPEVVWTHVNLARSHLSAGRFEEALAWSLRAVESPTAIDFAYCLLAAAYIGLDRPIEARAALSTARSLWPALTVSSLLGPGALPSSRDLHLTRGLLAAGLPDGGPPAS